MKKLILITFISLGFLAVSCKSAKKTETAKANAQEEARRSGGDRDGRRGGGGMEKMVEVLNLDKKQEVKFRAVNQKYRERTRSLRDENQGDRGAMRSAMQDLRKQQNQELKGILTVKQYQKYIKIQEEKRRERMENRGGGRRPNN